MEKGGKKKRGGKRELSFNGSIYAQLKSPLEEKKGKKIRAALL